MYNHHLPLRPEVPWLRVRFHLAEGRVLNLPNVPAFLEVGEDKGKIPVI